jgi:thioredoxin-like negative regulator of GroEL
MTTNSDSDNMSSMADTPEELIENLNNTKCVVLKYSASWCIPCKNKVFIEKYKSIKQEYSDNSNVIFLELDVGNHENFDNDFNVSVIPTIKLFKFGTLISQHEGINELDKVHRNIKKIVGV